MDIKDIARKSAETVREYMRGQARELNARNCNIDYGHTVFDDVRSIDAYVYPYGENALRAFIVLSDSYGDVLDIHSDIVCVECDCFSAVVGAGYWAKRFLEEHFADSCGHSKAASAVLVCNGTIMAGVLSTCAAPRRCCADCMCRMSVATRRSARE